MQGGQVHNCEPGSQNCEPGSQNLENCEPSRPNFEKNDFFKNFFLNNSKDIIFMQKP